MGGEDRRPLVLRRVAAHREVVFVHRVEARVAVPRLVHVDPVAGFREQRLHPRRVVAQAVVGAVGDHRVHRLLPGDLLRQRARTGLRLDRLGIHLGRRNRADDAVAVARRNHVDRARAGEHQALLDRLVAVAVADDEVVLLHAGLHDAAVRARGADDTRVAPVRAEHSRGVLLALRHHAGVVEQRAERAALDAHVGAEQVLAHEVEERAPGGQLGEGDAALVARRRPRVLAQLRVQRQRPRVRRQQLRAVALDRRHDASGDEIGRVLEQQDELVDHLGDLDGHAAPYQLAVRGHEHRDVGVALAQLVQQRRRQVVRVLAPGAEVPVEHHGAQRGVGSDDPLAVLEREGAHHVAVARRERRGDGLGGAADRGLGPGERVVDDEHARPQRSCSGCQHGASPSLSFPLRSPPGSAVRRLRSARSAGHGCRSRSRGTWCRTRARTTCSRGSPWWPASGARPA